MNLRLSAFAAALLLLGGCGGINGQTPAEMIRHSMSRQISHHNQYEFSGRAYAEFEFDENAAASDKQEAAETENQTPESREETAKTEAVLRKLTAGYGKATSIPYHGAVDLRQGKWEIVPALEMKTRNAHSAIKLPLQLDLKQGLLYADPEAVSYWTDLFLPEMTDIPAVNDRYLALRLPEKWRGKLPLRYLAAALPKAVEDAYAALPAEAFARLDMDEHGRKLGAAHRIGAKLRFQDYGKMGAALADSLHRQLSARKPPENMTEQDYQAALHSLKKLAAKAAEADEDSDFLNNLSRQNEWYLDRKGRLLAAKGRIDLPDSANQFLSALFGKPARFSLHNRYTLNYTKQPQFTIRPTDSNTWDISCLLDKEHGCDWLKKKRTDNDAESQNTETESPPATPPRPKNKRKNQKR